MARFIFGALLLATRLLSQTLVVDRPPDVSPLAQKIERADKGFWGDRFRIGRAGEVWMIDALTVWAIPAAGPACGRELGDSITRMTLLGALDNPPVPGQPVCDCHALVTLATVPLDPGSSGSPNPNAAVTREGRAWRIDFKDVRWSVPGGADVVFSLRATARARPGCRAGTNFSLAASPVEGYRLNRLDAKGVPIGLGEPAAQPGSINIRVWATPSR